MPKESGQKSELINLINPKFRKLLSNDIPARSGSVGGFIQNKPIVCGGKDDVWNYFQDCLVITDSFRSFNMRETGKGQESLMLSSLVGRPDCVILWLSYFLFFRHRTRRRRMALYNTAASSYCQPEGSQIANNIIHNYPC